MVRWLLPVGIDPEASLLLTALGLRAIGDGYMAVLLPSYLLAIGLDTLQVGIFRRRGDAVRITTALPERKRTKASHMTLIASLRASTGSGCSRARSRSTWNIV